MNNSELKNNDAAKLIDFVLSSRYTNLLYLLIKLGIPQHTNVNERSVADLANRVGADPESLYRLMRACKSIGVFTENKNKFLLTDLGKVLLSDSENSISDVIIWVFEYKRKVWDNALYTLKTGKPAFDKVYGKPLFDYLAKNPDAQELFDRVMTQRTVINTKKIVDTFDFSGYKTIADIGGGRGYLLSEILVSNKNAQGILFDSEAVSEKDKNYIKDSSVKDRCKLEAGNFFESLPQGADLYIMKEVLHDWNDTETLQILQNCKKVMHKNSKLLIIEHITDETQPGSTLLDIAMMLSTGGKERTKEEFNFILKKVDMSISKIYDTGSSLKIIEIEHLPLDT